MGQVSFDKGQSKSKYEKNDLMQVWFAMESLVIYRELLQDPVLAELRFLLEHLNSDKPDVMRAVASYSSLCHMLFKSGAGLKSYIVEKILYTENTFSREAETMGAECLTEPVEAAVKADLKRLQTIAGIKSETIKTLIIDLCETDGWQAEEVAGLPAFPGNSPECNLPSKINSIDSHSSDIHLHILQSTCWADCAVELAKYHHRRGSGVFSQYRAFVWRRMEDGRGYFDGVKSPDPITFSQLISYELERESVIENTMHFLEGYPANNILLYGDRGTGKSSTVKALVNEFHEKGLRIIEVPRAYLTDFPAIIGQLAGRNLKFILFIDDLAFEDNEENYTVLKAVLEGGLETRPSNVLIYATSNRKHLIKERFSDRTGLVSGNADDEVRAADTIQEKLSLSDRFGMTVVFSSPDQRKYLQIVDGIVESRGIRADKEFVHREALKWEMRFNGRSPRTARQFVDWLEGYIATNPLLNS